MIAATTHMLNCKAPTVKSCARWTVIKETLISPGIEASFTSQLSRKENESLKGGHTQKALGDSPQKREKGKECLSTYADKKGSPDHQI